MAAAAAAAAVRVGVQEYNTDGKTGKQTEWSSGQSTLSKAHPIHVEQRRDNQAGEQVCRQAGRQAGGQRGKRRRTTGPVVHSGWAGSRQFLA